MIYKCFGNQYLRRRTIIKKVLKFSFIWILGVFFAQYVLVSWLGKEINWGIVVAICLGGVIGKLFKYKILVSEEG